MESKVSGMFEEGLDPLIQSAMLAPVLVREFAHVLPLITRINKAHVLMLANRGILPEACARPLAQAVLALEAEGEGAFTLDPALEDPYFNYEAELIARTGSDIGGRVHTARSRNDLYATMDRLRARDLADRFAETVLALRSVLIAKAKEHRNVLAPGYIHMQPAQPVTYGYFLAGFAQALERDFARLVECRARINVSPLGAGAMAGTSFPIDREATAQWLGFDAVGGHAQDCIASRDFLAEFLSVAAMTATTWGRLAQDLFTMTTYEFGTLELPDSIAQTSSMMPQKKNMSALEVLRASSAQILGAQVTSMTGLKSAHYSFGFDSCCDAFRWAWDALEGAVRGAVVARVVVDKARPCADRMADLVRVNFSTATDLADLLVRDAGYSFRDAHHLVGAVVRAAMKQGMSADQVSSSFIAKVADKAFGWRVDLDADAVARAVDPAQAVQARRGTGGPSSHDLDRLFDSLDGAMDRDHRAHQATATAREAATKRLDAGFAALAEGVPTKA